MLQYWCASTYFKVGILKWVSGLLTSLPITEKEALDYILTTPTSDEMNSSTVTIGEDSSVLGLGAVYSEEWKTLLSDPTPEFIDRVNDINCVDCDDIARDFYKAANGKGQILDLTVPSGEIKVTEFNKVESFVDHRVYSDGSYIYDPRYSNEPVLIEKYMDELKKINS